MTEVPQWGPGRGSGKRSSTEAEAVYRHCLDIPKRKLWFSAHQISWMTE